jgi:S1-C subfamily serine protease
LVFLSGSLSGTTLDLGEGESTLGRNPDSAIRFDPGEVVVSGRHATIYQLGDRYFLRDEKSRNGTFLDGRPVGDDEVLPGQVVTLGRDGPSFRFEVIPSALGAPPTALASVSGEVMWSGPPRAEPMVSSRGAPADAASGGSGLTRLYVMAREQVAAGAPDGQARGTAVLKAFVRMAAEQSARRTRVLVALVGLAGAITVILVLAVGLLERGRLRGQLLSLNTQLEQELGSRASLETQLRELQAQTGGWQSEAAALSQRLSESEGELRRQQQTNEEMRQQRQQIAEQAAAVAGAQRFGPTVNERFAGGVCLIQLQWGYRNARGQWLRVRGTPSAGLRIADPTDQRAPRLTRGSFGTGFLVDGAGWILTNRHVATPFADDKGLDVGGQQYLPTWVAMRAYFPPGDRVFDLQVSVTSADHDLGLLRTTASVRGIPVLPIATAARIRPGDDLVLLGYPTGATNIFWRADSAQITAIGQAQRAAVQRIIADGEFDAALRLIEQVQSGAAKLTSDQEAQLGLVLDVVSTAADAAGLEEAARQRLVQPHSSIGTISDTTRRDVFHSAQMVGGASGGPLIGRDFKVLSVNYAFSLEGDRGATFQKNRGVPYSFIWSLMPAGLKSQLSGQ